MLLEGVTISHDCAIFRNFRVSMSADLYLGASQLRPAGVRSPNRPCLEPTRLRANARRLPPCPVDWGRPLYRRATKPRIDHGTARIAVAHRRARYSSLQRGSAPAALRTANPYPWL